MKDNLRILVAITKMIDASSFYAITVYRDDVKLQCRYNSQLIASLLKNKFKLIGVNSDTGYTTMKRGCIEVTLT